MKYLAAGLLIGAALAGYGIYGATAAPDTKGLLMIPAIDLIEPVGYAPLVGDQYAMPDDGVVWLEGTAWLDYDWARIVLAGHTPGDFERVNELEIGDLIILTDIVQVEWYEVELITVTTPDDTHWLMPTEKETLTLITCEGEQRRVVQAGRIQ